MGRGTPWGNPFKIIEGYDRDEACDRFERFAAATLAAAPHWLDPIKGKDLVCWCAPKRYHADTLLRLANPQFSADTVHETVHAS